MDSDNIGDFLYLILLVVFGIIGVFAKKKKKPVGTTGAPRPSSQTRDIFETLFPSDQDDEPIRETVFEQEDETDYEPFPSVKSKPEVVTTKPVSSDYTSKLPNEGTSIHEDTYSQKIRGTEISDQIKDMNPIKEGEIGYEDSSPEYDLSDPEEIKKAIIYSEILKAKYIH
ncbi:hypothetical protein ACE1ET_02525 [Saccharicrinis sp. FJH62]|uniref:hypothetical protein n=1 Tax=Saccharicrinis sp. FJH62 TaxID=3344657 RepID=UPI0035D50BEB